MALFRSSMRLCVIVISTCWVITPDAVTEATPSTDSMRGTIVSST